MLTHLLLVFRLVCIRNYSLICKDVAHKGAVRVVNNGLLRRLVPESHG